MMMGRVVVAAVVLLVVVVAAPMAEGAMTCGQVQGSLAQCLNYLRSGGAPPQGCCRGLTNIVNSARTTPERQGVCNCLKDAAHRFPGIQPRFAEALPPLCKVSIPYKISFSTNCASIRS